MKLPRAILFDMDGTLTQPLLDFPRIKREMGIEHGGILEALAGMSPPERSRAESILLEHEEAAARRSTLNEGCIDLLRYIQSRGLTTAVITRNSRSSTQHVFALHNLTFDVVIAREDGPHKPNPWPLLEACRRLNVPPADAWMVGDGEYDVQAGLSANILTIWLSHAREKHFPETPWKIVESLPQLTHLLKNGL